MKILCIGRNYAAHASELNNPLPDEPVVFLKPDTALHDASILYAIPAFTSDLHHEIEIVLRVGKQAKSIPSAGAWDYIDGVGIGIDFTARDLQSKLKAKGLPWEKSKAFDGSAVVSEFIDPSTLTLEKLQFSLVKNNVTVQDGDSTLMLYPIPTLIAHLSTYFTLLPGDLIFTGTPEGVGPISSGDHLEGFLMGRSLFQLDIQ